MLFEILLKYKLGSVHMYEHSFIMFFEKNAKKLKDQEYLKVFNYLIQISYSSDIIFWKDHFLPRFLQCDFKNKEDFEVANKVITDIQILIPGIDIVVYANFLNYTQKSIIDI